MKRALLLLSLSVLAAAFIVLYLPGVSGTGSIAEGQFVTDYNEIAKHLKERGKVPKAQRRPNDWFYLQRAYPDSTVPVAARLAARRQADELIARTADKDATALIWQQAGPSNIPGRITDLAVHPSQPNIIYAASAAGGVFKSTDFGNTWTAVFDSAGVQSIGAIAIHPDDPGVLYVGTGEANASGDSYEGTGVFKSTDGGATWSFVGLPNSYHIGRIAIDPLRPETVYVAAAGKLFGKNPDRGLYRSVDGGGTWDQILYVSDSTACIDVALHPSTGTVFAAMWERYRNPRSRMVGGPTSGLYRSSDHGDTWELLTLGLPPQSNTLGRIGVSVDPNSQTVYAVICDHPGSIVGVYRSDNLGGFFSQTDDAVLDGMLGGFGWYFGQVRVAPGNPDIVYVLGVDLYRSTDGGSSWDWATGAAHVDFHAMYILPSDPDQVYSGCDGGVNYSSDGAASWTVYDDMPNTQFYAITHDRNNPERLYGGTQDNGTLRTLTGSVDNWDHIHGGDGFYVIVDWSDPNVIYAEYQNGYLRKSTNLGSTFSYAMDGIDYGSDRHNWSTPIAMDPTDNEVLYYGSNRLYRTEDGADNWTAISGDLTDGDDPGTLVFGTITTIDVGRADPDVIYVGTDDANVWVTTNTGGTWTQINAGLPNRWVTRVTVSQYDAAVAYVAFSGYKENDWTPYLYRTADYGQSWTAVHGDLPQAPINDVLIDPHYDSTLYVATDFGVFYTTDMGQSWMVMGIGLPMVPVHDLTFDEVTRQLVAGTHGRSMYKLTVECQSFLDADFDGIPSDCDNCPDVANSDQVDLDFDLVGDACDNCPLVSNVNQEDADGDDIGDVCDICPDDPLNDADQDAICGSDDNCPNVYNPAQTDSDGDGIGDACDSCCEGIRGNVDGDAGDLVNIVDMTALVAYLFSDGAEPPCAEEGDINGDGPTNIQDMTHLVAFLFDAGPPPADCP